MKNFLWEMFWILFCAKIGKFPFIISCTYYLNLLVIKRNEGIADLELVFCILYFVFCIRYPPCTPLGCFLQALRVPDEFLALEVL